MSIIAYDGKMIAADKRGTTHGMSMTITKLIALPVDGEFAAWTGDQDVGLTLIDWYVNGKDEKKWPEVQKTDDFTDLIIANANGCYFYQKYPRICKIEDEFMAWGSGRDYAMAAMAMGANAREAVVVAIKYNVYCGNGIDSFVL